MAVAGELSWPSAGNFVSVYGEDLMAADTRSAGCGSTASPEKGSGTGPVSAHALKTRLDRAGARAGFKPLDSRARIRRMDSVARGGFDPRHSLTVTRSRSGVLVRVLVQVTLTGRRLAIANGGGLRIQLRFPGPFEPGLTLVVQAPTLQP
jgi:hypothetical protein